MSETPIEIPGDADDAEQRVDLTQEQPVTPTLEALQAQIARMQAKIDAQAEELAAAKAAPEIETRVFEPVTPHAEIHRLTHAEYQQYTCAELTRMIRAGEYVMHEPHVLCSDGWLVNPLHG